MGFWDAITGRSRPKANNLDALFAVPSAVLQLQAATGFEPIGSGSVCYRAAAGAAFAQTQSDVVALLEADPETPDVTLTQDSFGFTWLEVSGEPDDIAALCTGLHAVNTSLEAQGFSGSLLCTLIPFADAAGRRFGLVYLYKQGTFYPFAPQDQQAQRRDNLLELQIRDVLAGELPMEQDLQRWLAVWGAPGLDAGA